MHKVAPVIIGLKFFAELLFSCAESIVQMVPVHITDRNEAAFVVTDEMQSGHADPSGTDDTSGQLVTRSHIALVPTHGSEHLSGQNREERHSGSGLLDERSS